MKYFILLSLFWNLSHITFGQSYSHYAQNMKGLNVDIVDSTVNKALVICYNSGYCSACFKIISEYCLQATKQYPNIRVVVLVKGDNPIAMRTNTSVIQKYFNKRYSVEILYDMNSELRKRYFNKYKIHYFPSLLLFDKNAKRPQYIKYDQLFINDYLDIHPKTSKRINDFILKQINNKPHDK
ncbi:MAG: hypothetical protein LBE13_06190 [Bacteroidales bacterium]|jgi:hypothetical protein|nr:hypothetical protein [Bacteroidales bacterium]